MIQKNTGKPSSQIQLKHSCESQYSYRLLLLKFTAMKKILLFILVFLYFPLCSNAQQEQVKSEIYFYEVEGLVYVKEFNITSRTKTETQKIPKHPLRFSIVSKETDASDHSVYYVIKFPDINKETGKIASLVDNATFVNSSDNGKYYWIKKDELDDYLSNEFIKQRYRIFRPFISYGAAFSVPFKLRPKTAGQNIKITPELSLGGCLGFKMRLSRDYPIYISAPVVTLGLATLAINDNNNGTTVTDPPEEKKGDGTVLGITGSVGAIFQIKDFQIGLVLGWDRAAGELGKDWIYNNRPWFSFSIGFSFFGNKEKENK